MHALVSARRDAIAVLYPRFHVRRLEVFGSAARGVDFDTQRSDVGFLIEFEPDTVPTIGLLLDLEAALAQMLGRPADLVERSAIEESPNYLRRHRVMQEAEPVHVAG